MTQYKEFQGKTLDDAIREACDYYGVPREKLEIDILSDAKTGIFGLVGAKKAVIRAARMQIAETVSTLLDEATKETTAGDVPQGAKNTKGPKRDQPAAEPASVDAKDEARKKRGTRSQKAGQSKSVDKKETSDQGKSESSNGRRGSSRNKESQHSFREKRQGREPSLENMHDDGGEVRDDLPEFDLSTCDQEALFTEARTVLQNLINPIVGEMPIKASMTSKGLRLHVDCGDEAGLLVGREGQTLSSLQYLAARILSRRMGGSIRVQIDAGDYRERQDDRLRDLALSLAERVRKTGRAFSTRPLTAYQRRIVHLTLESDADVQTFSRGEGAQRRVFIQLKGTAGNETSVENL